MGILTGLYDNQGVLISDHGEVINGKEIWFSEQLTNRYLLS